MSGHSKWATTKHKKAVIDAKRGKMFAKLINNVKYVELKGASYGLTWTRADEINAELVAFLA